MRTTDPINTCEWRNYIQLVNKYFKCVWVLSAVHKSPSWPRERNAQVRENKQVWIAVPVEDRVLKVGNWRKIKKDDSQRCGQHSWKYRYVRGPVISRNRKFDPFWLWSGRTGNCYSNTERCSPGRWAAWRGGGIRQRTPETATMLEWWGTKCPLSPPYPPISSRTSMQGCQIKYRAPS